MEVLYVALSHLLEVLTEYWLIFLLVILSLRKKSILLCSATISIMLSLILLNRISLWFIFIFWIIIYIFMYYEYDDTKENNK